MDDKMLARKVLEVTNEHWPDAAHWKSTTKQHIQMLVEQARAADHDILNEVDHGDKHFHQYTTIPIYYAIFHGAKLNVVQYMANANVKGTKDWRSKKRKHAPSHCCVEKPPRAYPVFSLFQCCLGNSRK